MRAALALAAVLLATPSLAARRPMAPVGFQGVWADSALTCEALRTDRAPETGAAWIAIRGSTVSGTTKSTVTRIVSPTHFQGTDTQLPDVPVNFRLSGKNGLSETLGDARAAALYLKCGA